MRQYGKICRAVQSTDDNMAHEHCMLDTSGQKNALRICNAYRSPIVNIVARTYLIVTSYVQCLPSSVTVLYVLIILQLLLLLINTTNVGGTITTSTTIIVIANTTNISTNKINNNIRNSLFLFTC